MARPRLFGYIVHNSPPRKGTGKLVKIYMKTTHARVTAVSEGRALASFRFDESTGVDLNLW